MKDQSLVNVSFCESGTEGKEVKKNHDEVVFIGEIQSP